MTPHRLKDVLWIVGLAGLVAVVMRLFWGLGATTDLSDGIPWGLWKVLNMIAGVALATGGFAMAFAGHVLRIPSLKPLVKPAILVAFLGYGASCFVLLMDIGLPHRSWHPFVYWNEHSFLFEVFWCVSLYFTITLLEVSPLALEGSRFSKIVSLLHKVAPVIVVFGIAFSCMHHTSLGSLFLVSPTRLHEIWYTPWLPVHFILSALGAGLLTIVLLTLFVGRLYRREVPVALLSKVGLAAGVILAIYLVVRAGDLVGRGVLGTVFGGTWEANLFLVEIIAAAIVPIALIAWPKTRASVGGLATAALFAAGGLLLNRMNVGVFGYLRSAGVSYSPTLPEILLTLGIPALAGLVFLYFVEHFQIFDLGEPVRDPATCAGVCTFEQGTGIWSGALVDPVRRVSLLVLLVVPVVVAVFSSGASGGAAPHDPVHAPLAADDVRHVLRIDGDRNGDYVLFRHEDHKGRLGGEASCALCHHLDVPGDKYTACYQCHQDMQQATSIFDHEHHVGRVADREGFEGALAGNHSCAVCHQADTPRSRATAQSCIACHGEDMRMPEGMGGLRDFAPGYVSALHKSCVGCHEKKAEELSRPELAECTNCHTSR